MYPLVTPVTLKPVSSCIKLFIFFPGHMRTHTHPLPPLDFFSVLSVDLGLYVIVLLLGFGLPLVLDDVFRVLSV